jgi:hypothetical protein
VNERLVITTIDSLVEIFRAYFPEGDIPADARAVSLQFHPQSRKFRVVMESDAWSGMEPPLRANFVLKRVYGV